MCVIYIASPSFLAASNGLFGAIRLHSDMGKLISCVVPFQKHDMYNGNVARNSSNVLNLCRLFKFSPRGLMEGMKRRLCLDQ